VQNKLHQAITGKTAAEIIYTEADATKIYKGSKKLEICTSWQDFKSDVFVAKNNLNELYIKELNRIVFAYFDLAESNTQRQKLMYMKDWSKFLINFLQCLNCLILPNKGKVIMLEARSKAEGEFEKCRPIQDMNYQSDFDKVN